MVQGVSSGAGKSLLVCALCRSLARRGIRVAPFKAQNMSNNARVVDGGEIGSAQWLQALAAGVVPDVRMNPVLLKPESDTRSQVVVRGRVDGGLRAMPWRQRSRALWPAITDAFESLRGEYDVIVVEGAGSPAEPNLWDDDVVNMAVAGLADAPVLLVADIDRGGAFAHLYGTWHLLPARWRSRIEGFVLNKFRGDVTLLGSAPADLAARTGVPVVGVLPWLAHALPDEEGPTSRQADGRRFALVCAPFASNLDEFVGLQQVADVRIAQRAEDLAGAELVILPGSKHVAADLEWMRRAGIAHRVTAAAAAGVPVLGICGGYQMLGERIEDPHGVEGVAAGLGLLPVVTTYSPRKRTRETVTRFDLAPPWSWLSGCDIVGYEIRHGQSRAVHAGRGVSRLTGGLGFAAGNVLGLYLHGVFESSAVLKALTGRAPPALPSVFDQLADALDEHLDDAWIMQRIGG